MEHDNMGFDFADLDDFKDIETTIKNNPFSDKSFKRDQLLSQQTKAKPSIWKRFHGINATAYSVMFTRQGEKVKYDQWDSYPIRLLGCKFGPNIKMNEGQTFSKEMKR